MSNDLLKWHKLMNEPCGKNADLEEIADFAGGILIENEIGIPSDIRNSSRYPYTYACDFIRMNFDINSRSEASQKLAEMSKTFNQKDHEKLAILFAELYIRNLIGYTIQKRNEEF